MKSIIMVDELIIWPGQKPSCFNKGSCHLTVEGSLEDLHIFAAKLGMKRSWFQDHKRAPLIMTLLLKEEKKL